MPNPETVTVSARYFAALMEVRRIADDLIAATEGTDEYAELEDTLQCALGYLLMLEDGKDDRQKEDE